MTPSYDLSQSLSFLKAIKQNNNREWFTENKKVYQSALDQTILFADDLLAEMKKHDQIDTVSGKKSLFRIYRDVRFSKNKEPYKINFSGSFRRATSFLRGGYYFHIQPGGSFLAAGFWAPSSQDLKHIREQIAQDPNALRDIIADSGFKDYFGNLAGDQVKTAPKGFSKEDPAIDLLRYKQMIVTHEFSDKEVTSANFAKNMSEGFQHVRPFFDYMSDILTTDLNGESLLEQG